MAQSHARFIAKTSLFLALGILLPIAFHAFGIAGRVFLPMHFPPLLAGLLVGPASGLLVGLLSPGLSHVLTGMPPAYAVWLMTLELLTYGLIAGILYRRLKWNMVITLITAMIAGRLLFGAGLFVLSQFMAMPYTVSGYFSAAVLAAGLPGVALQLILIPILVTAIERRHTRKR
jgi:uncharacterized membrane protein